MSKPLAKRYKITMCVKRTKMITGHSFNEAERITANMINRMNARDKDSEYTTARLLEIKEIDDEVPLQMPNMRE